MTRWEKAIVEIMAYCKQHGLTAHTSKRDPLVFRKKKPKVKNDPQDL